ncbi:Vacuolar protein sorting-associated protein 11 [Yamadazyma tenuis]|uniref:E3 ubiquitin-protein ligase PEP5 n=1 Tax=Candida tenuis (strain ATCC 10573 / BCRC 21748 / CBS 615 / JCM 9827 / NBRC 10315 / NRRL Y-1498 / VKM Y-70) TaxID=590646 RepID=G3B628_CANTC|nr:uncharacterized protein CANTEDRAFT_130842 [Yamadazyma tenuis ATCC 10573]EGV63363.1 hypothetical protein CANTEDRAFT_130842 [Yamadazyma tenuis ATCC 10573]WEJ96811.1 Vacuolar protein sorting-associated protein 11 [Yamadazyma tenuis]
MSLPANWRQLQLFDVLPIRDPNFNTGDALYSSPTLSEIEATQNYMVITINGCFVKIISKQFTTSKSFMAYDTDFRISFLRSLPKSDLLVTIAEKQGSPSVLKLWDLNKLVYLEIDSSKEDPIDIVKRKFQTQVLIQNGDNSYPMSSFTFNADFTCLAIGYTNGKVLLVRGDLIRDRGAKQRLIYESPDPITGLHFNEFHELLYVTTTSRILTVPITGRNQGKPLNVLSKKTGVPLQCSVIDPGKQELIVGLDSSIRYYNQIGKSHTINFELRKKIIYRYTKNYLLMVSPMEDVSGSSRKMSTRVVMIDLHYKHISFSLTIPNVAINHVFEMWNDLYLLSSDGMLYKLHEKPINQQVELTLQRELFQLAYQLAKNSNLEVNVLLKICKLHGNFLYQKQDYEASISSYIKCLKYFTNENYVANDDEESLNDFIMTIITKFKDASNIHDLTEFLYQLYNLKIASNDHITLLLCCYCKLKQVDKIRGFIKEINLSDATNNADDSDINEGKKDFRNIFLDLDFPLIINLFKECGYFDEVIRLLYELNQPNLIVDIQLNDLKNPQRCLNYIQSLTIDDLLLVLIDHSKSLLDNLPIETTRLLINVFTGKYEPNQSTKILDSNNSKSDSSTTKEKSYERDEGMFPLNSYKAFLVYLSGKESEDDEMTISSLNGASEPTYLPPRPSLIFPSFINNPNEFVIFLEACIEAFDKYQGSTKDQKELLITLLEMYLSLSKKDKHNYEEWLNKAKQLVDQYSTLLDESSLLLVSHLYGVDGELKFTREEGFEETEFRTSQLSGDVKRCFEITKTYGNKKPQLYKMLLRFVISREEIFKQIDRQQFNFIINQLRTLKLASPLEIIQILGSTEFTTIGLIRDYLIETLDTAKQEITNNEKLVEYYEKESIKNSYKITELKTKPFVIQQNKCSACNLKLDFPVIHFKCKHSFHQRCLNDTYLSNNESLNATPTCSICINDIDSIQTLRDEQFRAKDEVELFESTLKESSDKFKVISNYLGKGVMENEFVQITNDV